MPTFGHVGCKLQPICLLSNVDTSLANDVSVMLLQDRDLGRGVLERSCEVKCEVMCSRCVNLHMGNVSDFTLVHDGSPS